MRFFVSAILSLGLLAYLALILFAAFRADSLIYQPPRPSTYSDDLNGLVRLRAADDTSIAALWLPNPGARHTILYFHGNGCDLGQEEPYLRELQRRGFAVLAWDYRGYGLSGGRPSEAKLYEDTRVVLSHLQTACNVPLSQIIAYGRSLGGGPAVELAAREPIGGLILESAFMSAFRVLTRWPIIPFDQYSNLRKLPQVDCPVLILHGTDDRVIPFYHGEALFAAVRSRKLFFRAENAGHYAVPAVGGELFWQQLKTFADGL
jgi:fermentation-respiration switch protein FrsA (DUF1100 family)